MPKVVLRLGDDVSTDVIYPGRYMATVLPSETPQFAFADMIGFHEALRTRQIAPGSVIAGGKNFGCGSSREQAVSALKGHELVIIAEGFARIFLQNSVNLGLRLLTVPGFEAREGDEIDVTNRVVINVTTKTTYVVTEHPPARQAIIDAGGLIAYTRTRLLASHATDIPALFPSP